MTLFIELLNTLHRIRNLPAKEQVCPCFIDRKINCVCFRPYSHSENGRI